MSEAAVASVSSPRIAGRGFRASLRNAKRFQDDVFAFCEELTYTSGGFREIAPFDLFGDHFLVNDPIEVARILTTNPDDGAFTKEGLRFFAVMRRLLGRGLFTSEGAQHLAQRRLLQPHFNQPSIATMCAGMIGAASRLADDWEKSIDEIVDVEAAMRRVSSDIAAEALLGSDLRDEAHEFGALADEEEEAVWLLMTSPFVLPAWIPVPKNRSLASSATRIRALVRRMIDKRRASIRERTAPDVPFTRMVAAELETGAMGEAQLLDEVATLVVGGYKTVAVAHVWTLYALATHPEIAARVRAEIAETIGERDPVPDDVPRLRYARMVVQESMRIYPPIWGIFRIATEDVELGGLRAKRGATLFMSPYMLHRNPRHWPNATVFDPENFRAGIERPAAAWLPFGAGRHKCIGIHFALSALVASVAVLARRFTLEPPAAAIEVMTRSFTSPKGGMRLRLRAVERDRESGQWT